MPSWVIHLIDLINEMDFEVTHPTEGLFLNCFHLEMEFRSIIHCGGRKTGKPAISFPESTCLLVSVQEYFQSPRF